MALCSNYKIFFLLIFCLFFIDRGHAASTRYNISASEKQNFVWFRVAKVGSRTITAMLKEQNVEYSLKGRYLRYEEKNYRDCFKFAFVRNPWDRVVSCYFNKVVTEEHKPFAECFGKGFDYFVDFINRHDVTRGDVHIKMQSRLFPVNQVNFIGHLENFSEDLNYVFEKIGLECPNIPHRNSSKHKHYSMYYDERTEAIIAKKYREDIKKFNYQFESKRKS